jgi:pilus assembly protein Flp/PilA
MITSIQFLSAWAQARYNNSDRGATMVEYALMVALIAVALIGAVQLLTGGVGNLFTAIGERLTTEAGGI